MRKHQMNPSRLDRADTGDGVLEFSLQRPLVIDLFVEFRSYPVRFVEQLETHSTALRSTSCRRLQSRFIEYIGGYF
jgi:hypothetical protein